MMKKRVFALLLSVVMLFCMMPEFTHVHVHAVSLCPDCGGAYSAGVCSNCGTQCPHTVYSKKAGSGNYYECTACGVLCSHPTTKKTLTDCATGKYRIDCAVCGSIYTNKLSNGYTTMFETTNVAVAHTMSNGKCTVCGYEDAPAIVITQTVCNDGGAHTWRKYNANATNGYAQCTKCKAGCVYPGYNYSAGSRFEHNFQITKYSNCKTGYGTRTCTACGLAYTGFDVYERGNHTYDENSTCTVCGTKCTNHNYAGGKCTECGKSVPPCDVHQDSATGKCPTCGTALTPCPERDPAGEHNFVNTGVCSKCGTACEHDKYPVLDSFQCNSSGYQYVSTKCSICSQIFTMEYQIPPNSHFLNANGECLKCTFKCEHEGAVDDGNCVTAVICGVCKAVVTPAKEHVPVNEDPALGCMSSTICGNPDCNVVLSNGHAQHNWSPEDYNCETAQVCLNANCGVEKTPAKTHVPGEDDGNCATAQMCTNEGCRQAAVPAKTHVPAAETDDCTENQMCTNPGCTQIAVYGKTSHTPGEDDGDCTTAVYCVNCSQVATAAKNHSGNATGDCEIAAKCTNKGCTKNYIEAKPHVNNNDDHNCLTEEKCDDCGKTLQIKQNTHTPAADDGDCTTDIMCTNSGCQQVVYEGKAQHTPVSDDGDCTTAVQCMWCSKDAVAAKNSHEPQHAQTDCAVAVNCKNCEKVAIAAKNHTPFEDDGDCTTAVTCSVCGVVTTEGFTKHDYSANGECTRDGCEGACTHEHTYGEVENKKESTCKDKGSYESVVYCSVCDKELNRETVELPLSEEHTEGEAVRENEKAATCKEAGSYDEVVYCSVCEAEISRTEKTIAIDSTKHVEIKQVAAQAATCTTKGWKAYEYCTGCTYTTKVEIPAGHSITKVDAKAPTCTEDGWAAYEFCTECTYTTYVKKAKLGHDEIKHVAKKPTCTKVGWDAYVTCADCDYTTYVEKKALGHDTVKYEAKEPTCTAKGWDAYVECYRCDYSTYVEKAALGHDMVEDKGYAATCTTAGLTDGKHCTRCNGATVLCAEIPALEHKWDAGKVTKEATAGHDGEMTYTCQNDATHTMTEVIKYEAPATEAPAVDNNGTGAEEEKGSGIGVIIAVVGGISLLGLIIILIFRRKKAAV